MSKRDIVLGLDISTTTIGVAVFDSKKNEMVHLEYYKPPKDGDLFERLSEVKDYIKTILYVHKPAYVAIEDIAQYMGGKSGAKTIIALAVFNRVIGLTVYEKTGKVPTLLNVNTIRKLIKTGEDRLSKEDIPEAIEHHLNMDFPYEYNKKGKIAVESYDMADAAAVALAFTKVEQ